MKKNRRKIALLICLVMCVALIAACGSDDSGPAQTGPSTAPPTSQTPPPAPPTIVPVAPPDEARLADEINVIVDNNTITVINQFLSAGNTSPTLWTWTMIHDRLIVNEGSGVYSPGLALDWRTTDYQTFVFDLREGVTFHNGDPFTAADVVFTINTAKEFPGTRGNDIWRIVDTVRAVNPFQVEMVLSQVHVDFFFDISMPWGGMVNQRARSTMSPDDWTWIGTGPFQVAHFETGSHVVLERYDGFWGEPAPTRQVTLRYVPEAGTRPLMLLSGEYQVLFSINTPDVPQFEAHADFTVLETIFNAPNCIGFNMADPLMSDYNFRMAVMHAINRDDVAMGAAGVWARAPQDGNNWGFGTEFRLTDIPNIPFDPVLARQYLADSPYNGETLEIAVTVRTNVLAAEVVQEQLRQNLGMETVIAEFDTPGFVSHVRTADVAHMHVFASSFTLSAAGSSWNVFSPDSGSNRIRYDNPFISDLISTARATTDLNARIAIFHEIQRYMAEDPPYMNLFWRYNPLVIRNGIGGMQLGYDALTYNLRGIYWVLED